VDELARFAPIEVTLRNSRRVRLREIRPDDRDEVQQAFGRLSSESRYMRFMSFLKELSPRMRATSKERDRRASSPSRWPTTGSVWGSPPGSCAN